MRKELVKITNIKASFKTCDLFGNAKSQNIKEWPDKNMINQWKLQEIATLKLTKIEWHFDN